MIGEFAIMTFHELAHELGRAPDWLTRNRKSLEDSKRIPPPLHRTPPLVWSRAQVYAYLDKGLTARQRATAAAFRAASLAALQATLPNAETGAGEIIAAAARLDERFVKEKA